MKKSIDVLIFGLVFFFFFTSFYVRNLNAVSPQMGKPSEKPQSDLIVEKVWLDLQCQIHFKIKNAGNGSISDTDHSKGVVRVYCGREHEDFYFTRASHGGKPPVDSAGALKSPGGSVQYDTKIRLESPTNVVVHVDADKKIMESNEENNRSSQNLTPQCPTISQVTPSKSVKPSAEEPKKMVPKEGFVIDKDRLDRGRTPYYKKDEGENGFRNPPWGDRKAETADQRERREYWGKTLQRKPIIVEEPKEYTTWFAGCQYTIAWRSIVETDFRIKIIKDGDWVLQTINPNPPMRKPKVGDYYGYLTVWTVPDNWASTSPFPMGGYFDHIVRVESLDGEVSGKSGSMRFVAGGLQMVSPLPPEAGGSPETGRTYERFPIIWNYWGCTFRTFDIILLPFDPPNLEPMYIQRALGLRPDKELPGKVYQQTFPWMVPPSVASGIYYIKIVGYRRAEGTYTGNPSVIGGPIVIRSTGR